MKIRNKDGTFKTQYSKRIGDAIRIWEAEGFKRKRMIGTLISEFEISEDTAERWIKISLEGGEEDVQPTN